MREFKFRAWDRNNNKMQYFNRLTISWDIAGRLSLHAYGSLAESPDFSELMQYTGLKDNNGKEIYDGDIIHWVINGENFIGYVSYSDREAAYIMKHEGCPNGCCIGNFCVDLSIIGNIHEDPDLRGK